MLFSSWCVRCARADLVPAVAATLPHRRCAHQPSTHVQAALCNVCGSSCLLAMSALWFACLQASDEASYITGTPLMVDGGYVTL